MTNNIKPGAKLFKTNHISAATFLGGPLAAGYLISRNYMASDNPSSSNLSLILGGLVTLILFGGLMLLPDSYHEAIPRQIIPAFYTGIVYLIVNTIQGEMLEIHAENQGAFHTIWRALGIGAIALIVSMGIAMLVALLLPDFKSQDLYEEQMEQFAKNEQRALTFFDLINFRDSGKLIKELDESIAPKWEENIKIIEAMIHLEDLPEELQRQNVLLKEYCNLRLKELELYRLSLRMETGMYSKQLDEINIKIEDVLNKLNEYYQ